MAGTDPIDLIAVLRENQKEKTQPQLVRDLQHEVDDDFALAQDYAARALEARE